MARVLVVDDVDTYRRYLGMELEAQGYDVETAGDAEDAIAVGSKAPPDVLIVDWMLNGECNGLDLADTMRAINPAVQTILITGYPSADLRREALRKRLWFVKKPFTLEEIAAAVDKAAKTVQ